MTNTLMSGKLGTDRTVCVGPRRYRGPAEVPGVILEVECPDWCAEDHTADYANDCPRRLADDFHESDPIFVIPPPSPIGGNCEVQAVLMARLMVHTTEGGLSPDAATIHMPMDGWDGAVDLGVAEADDLIEQLTVYTARLRLMRDQLAAIVGTS